MPTQIALRNVRQKMCFDFFIRYYVGRCAGCFWEALCVLIKDSMLHHITPTTYTETIFYLIQNKNTHYSAWSFEKIGGTFFQKIFSSSNIKFVEPERYRFYCFLLNITGNSSYLLSEGRYLKTKCKR